MNHIFDVLSSIGAAACYSPIGLDEIARMRPNPVEECRQFSAAITLDLYLILESAKVNPSDRIQIRKARDFDVVSLYPLL